MQALLKASKLSLAVLGLLALSSSPSAASALPGVYNGLFFEPDGVWGQSAGTITLKVTARDRFTGKLQLGPYRYSFIGAFDPQGRAVAAIPRRNLPALSLDIQINPDDPVVLQGVLIDEQWTADVFLDLAYYNGKQAVSPDQGKYTMIIPGNFTSSDAPGGDGYATITIDRAGRLKMAGALADGTKITQSSTVSRDGQWPLYLSLYRGSGALYGWMLFNQNQQEALAGDVTWIRPEWPGTRYYPRGFAITSAAWGSFYVPPLSGTKIVDISFGTIELNGGNLGDGLTNRVVLELNNRVTNLEANKMNISFSPSTGLFTGKVQLPVTWEWISFKGVVLQDYASAAGFFLDWDRSGEVWMQREEE